MTAFEKAIAYEWRSYIGSFICTGNPDTERLILSPTRHNYGVLSDYVNSPIRLVPQFGYPSNANSTYLTSTQIEVSPKAQLEREDWWISDPLLDSIKFG
jgi:hypothetical protein